MHFAVYMTHTTVHHRYTVFSDKLPGAWLEAHHCVSYELIINEYIKGLIKIYLSEKERDIRKIIDNRYDKILSMKNPIYC